MVRTIVRRTQIAQPGQQQCTSTKADGERCSMVALTAGKCWVHRVPPEIRQRNQAKGGQGNAFRNKSVRSLPNHLADAQETLVRAMRLVEDGEMQPNIAIVLSAVVARLIDLARFGLEISQAEMIEERLGKMETKLSETA